MSTKWGNTLEVAIVGAGPYGLSVAAHLRHQGIPFRIFGRPMDSWQAHMPKGMLLKSDGFASSLFDPQGSYTLERYCEERAIPYADTGLPVQLETFARYGLEFTRRMVPELEPKLVLELDRVPDGFLLKLEDGEEVQAKRIVLAVGITHFSYTPDSLALLPPEFASHSYLHHDLEGFRGRSVAVVGGGSSAIDLAGLLHEAGAQVQLVARQRALKFHDKPDPSKGRSLWQRVRKPPSGLGPGWKSRFVSDAPLAFFRLPERMRLEITKKHLGPSGGWFSKEKVLGRVPIILGHTPQRAELQDGKIALRLGAVDGGERTILADHIIAATGYKVDVGRLRFLSTEIRSELKVVEKSPILSSGFESSVKGLYFVGVAAANSFGPLMRFAYGAGFAARRVTETLAKVVVRRRAFSPAAQLATSGND